MATSREISSEMRRDSMSINFLSASEKILSGYRSIVNADDMPINLVIGNTGVGKSTLVNYLLDYKMVVEELRCEFFAVNGEPSEELIEGVTDGKKLLFVKMDDNLYHICYRKGDDIEQLVTVNEQIIHKNTLKFCRTLDEKGYFHVEPRQVSEDLYRKATTAAHFAGSRHHSGVKRVVTEGDYVAKIGRQVGSQTLYPKACSQRTSRFIYLDCPGFGDNRFLEDRLAASVCTELALKRATSVQGILILIPMYHLKDPKCQGLLDLMKTLVSLFPKPMDMFDSFIFVVTHIGLDKRPENVSEEISEKFCDIHAYYQEALEAFGNESHGGKYGGLRRCDCELLHGLFEKLIDDFEKKVVIADVLDQHHNKPDVEVKTKKKIEDRICCLKTVANVEASRFTQESNLQDQYITSTHQMVNMLL